MNTKNTARSTLLILAASSIASSSSTAWSGYKALEDQTESAPVSRGMHPASQLHVGAGLHYFDAFGIHARYAGRLIDQPIADIDSSIGAEIGVGLTFYGTKKSTTNVTGLGVLGAGRFDWNYDYGLSFFGLLGAYYNAVSNNMSSEVKGAGFGPVIGVGAQYAFTSEWSARADLSYPVLGIGITRNF